MRMLVVVAALFFGVSAVEAGPLRSFLANPSRPPLLRLTESTDLAGRTFTFRAQTQPGFVGIIAGQPGGARLAVEERLEILGRPFGYRLQTQRPFVRIFIGLRR